jgi:hypothetical protein
MGTIYTQDHIAGGTMMLTAKQEVIELLKDLPDTSTLEEIQYHLYVRQKVQRGIQDVEEGRVYTQEEVEKRMEKWVAE